MPTLRPPRIHAFIFSWRNYGDDAKLLSDLISPLVHKTTVISSGGAAKGENWVMLDSEAYFGEQWNAALSQFDGDILFHHQADARVRGDGYRALISRALHAGEQHHWGVYAPNVHVSAWRFPQHKDAMLDRYLQLVPNTDCTAWMIQGKVIDSLPKHFETKYGWGIDFLYCCKARSLGLKVIRDHAVLVDHAVGTNYDRRAAQREFEQFKQKYADHFSQP
jgi:hypothetical protein